jgi:DNA-binding transcriptional LysR family regulator
LVTIMSATTSTSATSSASWAGLELRHLLALVAVAETGTFSGAAERLGYTQSAVSQQIGALERIVGTTLFERPGGPRPVRLTPPGEMLLTHARSVLDRVQVAAADLRALATGELGELRVGTLQSVGTKVLPGLLRSFRADWPGIEVSLRESNDINELIHLVETGDLDVTFVEMNLHDSGRLTTRWLLDDPMVFVAPSDAPEAARERVSVADVAHLPMIGIGPRDSGCHRMIEECFRGSPVPPTYVFRSEDNPTVLALIAAGLAYAVLPLLTVDEDNPGIAVIPIEPEPAPRRLGVAWPTDRQGPAALEPFIDAAAEICHGLSSHWEAWRVTRAAS